MDNDAFRQLIERGDVEGADAALGARPELANETIRWFLSQPCETDPLHYVSDCVFNGWLTNGREGELAAVLLRHGADIDGSGQRETPLIGATSLGVPKVAQVLIEAGANLEATSVFGARALHWAAWMGLSETVASLLLRGAELEPRCTEFGATPLFWAVHGASRPGSENKRDQVGAARALIEAGANPQTTNKEGVPMLELAKHCETGEMRRLLEEHSASAG